MGNLTPVEYDPFAAPAPKLTPVEGDPFAQPHQRTLGQEALRQLGLTARHTLSGLAAFPTMVGNAANAVVDMGTGAINDVAGTNIPKIGPIDQSGLDLLGKPETMTERIVQPASEFLASIPGFAGTAAKSGIEALKPLTENLAQQATGAIAGGAAMGATREVTDNPLVQTGAALVGSVLGGRGGMKSPAKAPPTTSDLKAAGSAAYKTAEDAGLVVKPVAMQNLASSVKADLANLGYHPKLQPKIQAVLEELDRVGGENISLKGIDVMRRIVGNAAASQDPTEKMMASRIIEKIDDTVENLKPEDVLQGNVEEATKALTKARELWGTMRKSQTIENLILKAEDRAASTNSGGNLQNTIRQNLRTILDNPKKSRGFTKDELDAIRQVVRGTPSQNALRLLGRLAPSSNAWLGILSTFALPGVGLAVPVGGSIAKAAATRSTEKSIEALSALVRSGGKAPAKQSAIQRIQQQPALIGTPLANWPFGRALPPYGQMPAIADPNRPPQGRLP